MVFDDAVLFSPVYRDVNSIDSVKIAENSGLISFEPWW